MVHSLWLSPSRHKGFSTRFSPEESDCVVEIEVESLEEARELASKNLVDEEVQFKVYDEQSKCILFVPDGIIYDEDGNEIEEDDN